ncbi:MAG: hypothetical protein LHV68_00915 [Elusimicrobia bacterium]|nr:hypothetical protein [Candidatus Liberimonas magnetica]
MSDQQKAELTKEQISILLQIINKTSVIGEQVEVIAHLKQTLVQMFNEKKKNS